MKARYRKFTIGKGKYSFWLRYKQTLTRSVMEYSKIVNICVKKQHREKDYNHTHRRKSKKFKEVLLGFSEALEKINFLKDENEAKI